MRCLGRSLAIVLFILIAPATACAFWLFNANRVALDANNYKNALQNSFAYTNLMTAVIQNFSSEETTPRQAGELFKKLPPDAWATLSSKLMRAAEIDQRINEDIDALFNWINGKTVTPEILLDFTALKQRLTEAGMSDAMTSLVTRLPRCQTDQITAITDFKETDSFARLTPCNPPGDTEKNTMKAAFTSALLIVSKQLPDQWNLLDDIINGQPTTPINSPDNNHVDLFKLNQFRSAVVLQGRLLTLLFLIPVALMCLIVIVTIRSFKALFRWLGVSLVVSGFFSLIPVFILPLGNSIGNRGINENGAANLDFGEATQAITVLVESMVQSIINALTLSVLLQVAALIIVGLIAIFISVLILPPEDELGEPEAVNSVPAVA